MKKLFWIFLIPAIVCGCQTRSQTPASRTVNLPQMHQQAKDITREALADENPHIRTNAVEVAASTKQLEMMPMVEHLLTDNIVPVRFAAALAIGDVKYQAAETEVKQLLSDKNPNVQLAAAYAVYKLGGRSYDNLFSAALAQQDQTIRANAALILGKMGRKSAISQLKTLLRDSRSADKTMFAAVEAMARLGDESVYSKLWALLLSTYADDRVVGIRAMGALGTQPARNALITMLDDRIIEVRLAAAEQLGSMGDTSGEPEVMDFFTGNNVSDAERTDRAKALAALAIGRIKTGELIKYLPDLLISDSEIVRLAAAKAALLVE